MNVFLLPLVSSYPDCILFASGVSFFSSTLTSHQLAGMFRNPRTVVDVGVGPPPLYIRRE